MSLMVSNLKMDNKLNLFDDEDENQQQGGSLIDNEGDFSERIEKKLAKSGHKSQKLIALQSRFAADSRFQVDERFLEDDDEDEETNNDKAGKSEFADEKSKNISILEEVLGKPLRKPEQFDKKANKSTPVSLTTPRYDPTKEESKVYEVENREVDISRKKIRVDFDKVEEKLKQGQKAKNSAKLVDKTSKETFYEVSSGLKDAFTKKEEDFSFGSFFGMTSDEQAAQSQRQEQLKLANEQSTSTQLKTDQFRNPFESNPFKYDSSDSEDEKRGAEKATTKKYRKTKTIKFPSTFGGFFFAANDARFTQDPFYSEELVKKVNDTAAERQLNMTRAFSSRRRAAMKNLKTEKRNALKRRLKMRMLKMRRNKNWKYSFTKRPRLPGKVGVVNVART